MSAPSTKMLNLIFANVLRNRLRTALIIASFATGSCLYGILATIEASFKRGIVSIGADRLIVKSRISFYVPLPLSHRSALLDIPGVDTVTPVSWLGGIYQNERNFFPQIAIDPETFLAVYAEYEVPEEQWRMFTQDRQGCIIGEHTAKRFGWKLGDRIPIIGAVNPGRWEFNLRGIYRGKSADADTTQMWIRHDYLDENRIIGWGTVGWYVVKIKNPDQAATVLDAIDRRFLNSAFETETETESAISAGLVRQVGNLTAILLSVGFSGFLTILLITGSAMVLSVKERAGEIALLKALGFSDLRVLGIVLGECALCAALGGGLGLLAAKLFTLSGDPTGGLLLRFYLGAGKIAFGVCLALTAGLLSGAVPGIFALRLRIADAMRRV